MPTKRSIAAKKAAETRAAKKEKGVPSYCGSLEDVYKDLMDDRKAVGGKIRSEMMELKEISGPAMPMKELGPRTMTSVAGLAKSAEKLKALAPASMAVDQAIKKLCKLDKDEYVSCTKLKSAMSLVKAEKKVESIKDVFKDLKCHIE